MSVLASSDLMVSTVMLVMLFVSVFFSFLYEMDNENTWAAVIASLVWSIFAAFFLIAFPEVGIISLFFGSIGILYTIRWFIDVLTLRGILHTRVRKMEDDD